MRPAAAAMVLMALAAPAAALEADYRASVAGVPVGGGRLRGSVEPGRYDLTLTGDYGMALWTSRFTNRASGAISGTRVLPARYVSTSEGRDITRVVTIAYAGTEARATIEPPPEAAAMANRVPLTDAHRRGVLDPLSGLLSQALRAGAAADPCEGLVQTFSGWARFDIGLRAQGPGEDGTLTCRVAYRPIAGHRPPPPGSPRPVEGRPITVAFKPAPEAGLRLPERIEVPLTIGSLVIQRTR